jgi:hypothetical protein
MSKKETMYCSHCGNHVHYRVIDDHKKLLKSSEYYDDYEYTRILVCEICEGCTIKSITDGYRDAIEDEDIHLGIDDWFQIYPDKYITDKLVPDEIRDLIEKARLEMRRSPDHFFISIRIILERILDLCGFDRKCGNLKKRINIATEKLCWPSEVNLMAHYIRERGNKPAHEVKRYNQEKLEVDLKLVDYCIENIINTLYVLPKKIEEIKRFK